MYMAQSQFHAHMPFLFRRDRHVCAVFCQSIPRFRRRNGKIVPDRPTPWKLQWIMPYLPAMGTINTGLHEYQVECSPTVSENKGGLRLSFIGTIGPRGLSQNTVDGAAHRLFVMEGPEINQLGSARLHSDEECYCGFSRPDLTLWSSGNDGVINAVGQGVSKLYTSFEKLNRISYCFDEPSQILVTGSTGAKVPPMTVLIDISSGRTLGEVRVNNYPTYKPSILSDMTTAPVPPICKQGWRLWYGSHYSLLPCSIATRVE
jgi:hypothetical protein